MVDGAGPVAVHGRATTGRGRQRPGQVVGRIVQRMRCPPGSLDESRCRGPLQRARRMQRPPDTAGDEQPRQESYSASLPDQTRPVATETLPQHPPRPLILPGRTVHGHHVKSMHRARASVLGTVRTVTAQLGWRAGWSYSWTAVVGPVRGPTSYAVAAHSASTAARLLPIPRSTEHARSRTPTRRHLHRAGGSPRRSGGQAVCPPSMDAVSSRLRSVRCCRSRSPACRGRSR